MDTINQNELYHYGVKGMKWGIRRYQNDDGSLTNMGKIRYGVDESGNMSRKGAKLYEKHRTQYKKNPDKISFLEKKYQKTFDKMKNKGLSDLDAGKIASGKVRTAKCLVGIGAVTATALAAVGVARYIEKGRDITIKAGNEMQTVHREDAKKRIAKGKAFYMSFTEQDNTIYSSKLFSHTTAESKVTKFKSKKDIKIASVKSSRKAFEELMETNPKFRESVMNDKHLRGKTGQKLFEDFQYQLVLRDKPHAQRSKIYYKTLAKKGYGGLIDNNDSWREGFTYKPTILFGKEKKQIVSTKMALSKDEVEESKKFLKAVGLSDFREFITKPVSKIMKPAAVTAGTAAVSGIMSNNIKYVRAYRKAHPNTQLSSSEILDMLNDKKKK